jgi:hypothetical protein
MAQRDQLQQTSGELPQLSPALKYEVREAYRGGLTTARFVLALCVVLVFVLTIVFAFVSASGSEATWTNTKELLNVLIPVETGILGTVFGFFFGREQGSAPRDER